MQIKTTERYTWHLDAIQQENPAIPLLGIYLKKMKIPTQKDVQDSMFTTALLTIANTWKQPIYTDG